jgi:hypothetical protein
MEEESVSDEFLCGHLSMASRRLGFLIREVPGVEFQYSWLDGQAGQALNCQIRPTKKEAFVQACKDLQKYLSLNPNAV